MMNKFSQVLSAKWGVWVIALVMAAGLSMASANAQEKKAGEKKPQNPWVKLCLDEPALEKGEDGKVKQVKKNTCYTMTERLDINTGMVLSAIKLRKVEGQKKQALIVTVPLGMALSHGARMLVYTGPQWKAALKKEQVDTKNLKEVKLRYLSCDVIGCDAGVEATKEIVDLLKKSAGVNILALNTQGRIFSSPMPLKGFTAANKGKPVDNKQYAQARRQLMVQIQERRRQQAKDQKELKALTAEKNEIDKRRKAQEKN